MHVLVARERCRRDGICVEECPNAAIELREGEPTPVSSEHGKDLCILCGHCVAVCPQGAISVEGVPESTAEVERGRLPAPEQVEHLLRTRRSIRVYLETEIPQPVLERLLDTVRYAPSGFNRQPVRWLVMSGRRKLKELSSLVIDWMRAMQVQRPEVAAAFRFQSWIARWDVGEDPILRGAPHLVLAQGAKADPTASRACTIATAHLELLATSFGLGACWAGLLNLAALNHVPLQQALGLPGDQEPSGALMIGYPKYAYRRIPSRERAQVVWR